ncbi:CoA transferase [Saccharopolyspora sp.]|uniref:CoA transferase n=1 Tax=Saccharopolyspora sp. TaxID=33915 RepID=UPI0025F572EB|nr:CoA transferase [Saccharopolyspora sp.]
MSAPPTAPDVASAVAAGQLDALELSDPDVECVVDWSGPVQLPLHDEASVQAACGIMHVHGRAAGRPVPLAVDYASTVAGVLAAQGVLAATIARARGARVNSVRTSVAQAALLSVQQYLAAATADDPPEEVRAGLRPPFTTADGVRIEVETLNAEAWQRFWRALGAADSAIARGWWPFQQRFATATCGLPAALHDAVGAATHAEIRTAAEKTGISVLPVRDEPTGPMDLPACTLTHLPGSQPHRLPPPGALPLDGIVVVESTRRVQGPAAGHVLRMLGADVVRIEPPGGDPMRGVPPMVRDRSARYLALNAGKRVVELDLKTPGGCRGLRELVAEADVFLHNWAPGKAAQLGLDAQDLASSSPGLVYAWASGWGSAMGTDPPLGTDFLVQAHSGLAAAISKPAAPSLMTLTDVLGGLVCAQGVLAALLRRLRTGSGSRVDTSLLSAAGVVPRHRTDRRLHRTRDGFSVLPEGSTSDFADRREMPTEALVSRCADAGPPVAPVCTDLAELAADPRFRHALGHDGHTYVRTPWEFS